MGKGSCPHRAYSLVGKEASEGHLVKATVESTALCRHGGGAPNPGQVEWKMAVEKVLSKLRPEI